MAYKGAPQDWFTAEGIAASVLEVLEYTSVGYTLLEISTARVSVRAVERAKEEGRSRDLLVINRAPCGDSTLHSKKTEV